jgi:hypothetical protein
MELISVWYGMPSSAARLEPRKFRFGDGDRNPLPLAIEQTFGCFPPECPPRFNVADRNPFAALGAVDQVALIRRTRRLSFSMSAPEIMLRCLAT